MMKFIIGKKLDMTQVFREDGTVVPVTRIQAGPCTVTKVNTEEKDGVKSVQIGFGIQKLFRLTKPEKGHLKGISIAGNQNVTVRNLHNFKNDNDLKRGDVFTISIFEKGEKVQVTGNSKGRGFQGVVKRHGFHGSPASHGHKDQLRMPGSIGAGGVQHVFKDTRMAGHMGDVQITVKNLEIVEIHPENNEIWVKGAVPGARNGVLYISTDAGQIVPQLVEETVSETKNEENILEDKKESAITEEKESASAEASADKEESK
ncbi:MAG: 50S ribosomal protein L3 [Candidatus Magasanikbacteria bacterium CG_4_10_14_0_8_um_filter_32_14]|uniref:Large ribosomal subunit protein uL3 n=1 Tax=Candidatus Magasanikbacteria bacterium CG_4_10_14_0_8_um_filter_32_14 TaxID=1974640 RepID=A0A2M7R8Q5_9BACT|nr:MAG: 50S ribosomal protein L3 [Candidatus Magasanikbacteria bacterium CG_4_10_14_0_8_um_filter_32_14]